MSPNPDPSPSAGTAANIRVHHSSTRRKACSACVKAKRRCDLRLPACTRCTRQHIKCLYAGRPSADAVDTPPAGIVSNPSPNEAPDLFNGFDDVSWMDLDAGLQVLDSWDEILYDFNTASASDLRCLAAGNGSLESILSSPSPWTDQRLVCVVNENLVLQNARLLFCKEELRSFIPTLVSSGHAPFIHSRFGRIHPLDDTRQDLWAVAALYAAKNEHNADIVDETIETKVARLRDASVSWVSTCQQLFGLQALVMYQIMRLFDCNARQRARGERDIPLMLRWMQDLRETATTDVPAFEMSGHFRVPPAEASTSAPPPPPPPPSDLTVTLSDLVRSEPARPGGHGAWWECTPFLAWAMAESVRRTILVARLAAAVSQSLRTGRCDDNLWWELVSQDGGTLWQSREDEWWARTHGRPDTARGTLLSYKGFLEHWAAGRVGSVGSFERMLLAVCCGILSNGRLILSKSDALTELEKKAASMQADWEEL